MRIPSTLKPASGLLALLSLSLSSLARPAYGNANLLVVTDGKDVQKDDFTTFWSSLEARGYTLTFRDVRNSQPKNSELLTRYEEKQYDGVILFAPSAKSLPTDLSPQALFSYLTTISPNSTPGNILIALSSSLSETWRDFAREFSIEFDERETALYDPLNSSSSQDGLVVDVPADLTISSYPVLDSLDSVSSIVSPKTAGSNKPIRYSGLVHQAIDLPLLMPILRAPATSYPVDVSSSEKTVVEGGPLVVGEAAKLVSGFQTRVNSRVVWSGSLDLFSDAYNTPETGNEAFVQDLTKWLFGEKGVVKVEGTRHYAQQDAEKKKQKEQYRIGEGVVYEIVLSEWNGEKWIAPSTITDLQLEVTMLDPHLRIPLTPSTDIAHRSSTSRTYTAVFKLPDRHGVFTLLVDHKRQGMTWLEEKMQISITPLRHDEYPRFITGAMPYYLTAGSMVVAWFIFSALWLGIKEHDERGKWKKKMQ